MSRVMLRSFDDYAARSVFAALSDQRLYELVSRSAPRNVDELVRDLDYGDTESLVFSVHLCSDPKEGIGIVEATARAHGEWSVGYMLGYRYWGQGFGTEMLGLLLEQLVSRNIRSACAHVDERNAASVAVLRKSGFSFVRTSPAVLNMRASTDLVYCKDLQSATPGGSSTPA